MLRRSLVLLGAFVLLVVGEPAFAQTDELPASIAGSRVVIEATPGVRLVVDGSRFAGPMDILGTSEGLGLTEETTLDAYLEGIAEVPFDWPVEALRAQAVAARTYLAWTLSNGRTSNGRRFGYDICATTQCQVYAGVGVVEGWGGERWRQAVESTTSEILLYQGSPAQALYSSTSSGRTRSVEDIFPGASPTPYLVAVESPDEDSPFVEWGFNLASSEMSTLLDEAGLLQGGLLGINMDVTPDGGGSWIVEIEGTSGTTRIGTWELRTELNAAASVLGDLLPPMRPDVDRRYPQTILSPTFTIGSRVSFIAPSGAPPRIDTTYEIRGAGWGHLVGMSQFGAEAMASRGAAYEDILTHYYTGLRPENAQAQLPDTVVIGLAAGAESLEIGADGPVVVRVDGEIVAEGILGTWRLEQAGSGVRLVPPIGLGTPPNIGRARVVGFSEAPIGLEAWLSASAEVRVLEQTPTGMVPRTGWAVADAGPVRWRWSEVVPSRPRVGATFVIEARSPDGEDSATVTWIPGGGIGRPGFRF